MRRGSPSGTDLALIHTGRVVIRDCAGGYDMVHAW